MPNVYVGQYADIRHSAVYASIDEAVKEVQRVIQSGLMIAFVNLPDIPGDRYWVAGTVGKTSNPKFNLIFTNKDEANTHIQNLKDRGWTNNDVIVKELKVIKSGPKVPDVKTEEHLQVERKYDLLRRALERGLELTNNSSRMEILVTEDDKDSTHILYNKGEYGVFSLDSWNNTDPVETYGLLRRLRSIINEFARVNPDEQPNKWRRLQETAALLVNDPFYGAEALEVTPDVDA